MLITALRDTLHNLTGVRYSQAALGNLLGGLSQAAINNRITNNIECSIDELIKIEKFLALSPGSLTGIVANDDCLELDYYPDIYASCGNGCMVFDESKDKITVAKSTIPYYSNNEKYFVVTCKGSSMSPILEDDDKAIIQQWQGEQIIDDRIYLFSYNSELFIKRLVKNLDQIVVISENKTFENRIVTKKDEFRIIGQIVGMFRDLK